MAQTILINKCEGHALFNNPLNTFYLLLYGVRHMVKDHSDSESENPLPPHGLLFHINSNDYFICTIMKIAREETDNHQMGYSFQLTTRVLYFHHPTDRIAHTMAFVQTVIERWMEREITQCVHHEGCILQFI